MNAPTTFSLIVDGTATAAPAQPDEVPSDALAVMTSFPREAQAAFLSALAECGQARRAARAAGVSHQTVYRARRACAAFRRGWDAALIAARAFAEDVLATRALDGVEEEIFYRGELIGTRRRYDSRLLLAHLARLDRLTGAGQAAAGASAAAGAEAFAEDFDGALERFAAGSDTPERDPEAAPDGAEDAPDTPATAPAAVAETLSPGQWSTRSTPPQPACRKCGGRCLDAGDLDALHDCPNFAGRLVAMEAARPAGACEPDQLSEQGDPAGEVEAEQLAAFEAGVERWWLVMPAEYDEHVSEPRDGWCYFEPAAGGR